MERLYIENFSCIKEVDIQINKINFLIGEQAGGKSVCAKLLYFFKDFPWEIVNAKDSNFSKRQIDKENIAKFKVMFPPSSWGDESITIRYERDSHFIELKRPKGSGSKLKIRYSESYQKVMRSSRNLFKKYQKEVIENYQTSLLLNNEEMLMNFLASNLVQNLDRHHLFSQIFIPAGRSFFALVKDNIFPLLSQNQSLDPLLIEFGRFYTGFKQIRQFSTEETLSENSKKMVKMAKLVANASKDVFEKVLHAKFIEEGEEEFLLTDDGRKVRLALTSSGQQEILPLILMLPTLYFLQTNLGEQGKTVYIEEPEAHLFPDAQRIIIESILTVYNFQYLEQCQDLSTQLLQLFITTHSPYILTAVNNLLQSNEIRQNLENSDENPEYIQEQLQKLNKIIPIEKQISIQDISAYKIESGKTESILDLENHLIDATMIDQVSEDIAIKFEDLLELSID